MRDTRLQKKAGNIICMVGDQNPGVGLDHQRIKFINANNDIFTDVGGFNLMLELEPKGLKVLQTATIACFCVGEIEI